MALAGAVAFGVICSVAKGNGGGSGRGGQHERALGDSAASGGGVRGSAAAGRALIGLIATLLALTGFYLANAFVLDLGPHSTLHDIWLTLSPLGNPWFRFGVISGSAFGALGAWLAGRHAVWLGAAVAALLIFEPAAWVAWLTAHHQTVGESAVSPGVWVVEIAAGIALAVTLYARRAPRRS